MKAQYNVKVNFSMVYILTMLTKTEPRSLRDMLYHISLSFNESDGEVQQTINYMINSGILVKDAASIINGNLRDARYKRHSKLTDVILNVVSVGRVK